MRGLRTRRFYFLKLACPDLKFKRVLRRFREIRHNISINTVATENTTPTLEPDHSSNERFLWSSRVYTFTEYSTSDISILSDVLQIQLMFRVDYYRTRKFSKKTSVSNIYIYKVFHHNIKRLDGRWTRDAGYA